MTRDVLLLHAHRHATVPAYPLPSTGTSNLLDDGKGSGNRNVEWLVNMRYWHLYKSTRLCLLSSSYKTIAHRSHDSLSMEARVQFYHERPWPPREISLTELIWSIRGTPVWPRLMPLPLFLINSTCQYSSSSSAFFPLHISCCSSCLSVVGGDALVLLLSEN